MSIAVSVIIYTVLVFATSTIGAMTGIGGGVMRKPIMDAMGDFNAAQIAFLNVVTILAMSSVSIMKQSKNFAFRGTLKLPAKQPCAKKLPDGKADTKAPFTLRNLVFLSVGSVVGGVGGEYIFAMLVKTSSDALVKLIQNSVLLMLILLVFVYMLCKAKIPTAKLKHPLWFVLSGLFLGILASFLGIGGGPMNLAVLMLMFSMTLKEAAFSSLTVIMVSQVSKLITSAISGTIIVITAPIVYISVGFLAAGAVAGGFIGSVLSKKFSEKTITVCFNCLQLVLIGIVIYNIVQNAAIL